MPESRFETCDLTFRVVDYDTGDEIIRELPWLPDHTWLIGFGNFRIQLFPIRSDDYRAYAGIYAKLRLGQKIEAYHGRVGSGPPLVSGYVMEIYRSLLGSHEVSGRLITEAT